MSVLRDLLEHFVEPPTGHRPSLSFVPPDEGPGPACAEPAPRTPSGLAVLAPAGAAQPIGAALGLALAARSRARIALVCVWTAGQAAGPAWRAPAVPAARRLATTLGARGHDAMPTGRLVLVRLAPAALDASVQARRAAAAGGGAPVALALGGPRVDAFDELLAEQDIVVVATPGGTDPTLARLALAGLAPGVARACACVAPPARPALALAAAGLALLPSVRRPLEVAIEALP